MKTPIEIEFDNILKESFNLILNPLGFKKRNNNYFLAKNDLGQIINIQKSKWSTKDKIQFTINTGIFIPEYWKLIYGYYVKEMPKFPTEPECAIRKRIGVLRQKDDIWYDLDSNTDEKRLISIMKENLYDFILPYFDSLASIDKILDLLESGILSMHPLDKIIFFGEFKRFNSAKIEYDKLVKEKIVNSNVLQQIKEYGLKYGLE
jgi:hypothetical protein